jgi:hypothetical protein
MNFVNNFKQQLFNITPSSFEEKALDMFYYQSKNNSIYKEYLKFLKVNSSAIKSIEQIPFMPIEFFKYHKVITGEATYSHIFLSSGTTMLERSKHYVKDIPFYERVSETIFNRFYGNISDYTLLALLPSYQENPQSSLICMIDFFIKGSNNPDSGYIKPDYKGIEKLLEKKQVILFGVTYALLDFAEHNTENLKELTVIETGGMKGRREEMPKEEFYSVLKEALDINSVHAEYGMTELLSQAYSKGDGIYECPPWMKVLIREINDPFAINDNLKTGGINIIDLANIDSCAFIETKDIGTRLEDGRFKVMGRFDNSDVRGCSLLYS